MDEIGPPVLSRMPQSAGLTTRKPVVSPLARMLATTEPRAAAKIIAATEASLEQRLEAEPHNYPALLLLGELKLRIGLPDEAAVLFYRAASLDQPNWQTYQYLSYLQRRAEEQLANRFERRLGIRPPEFLMAFFAAVTGWFRPTPEAAQ